MTLVRGRILCDYSILCMCSNLWRRLLRCKDSISHTKRKGHDENIMTFIEVGVKGFEPSTPWSQTKCANRTALHPYQFFFIYKMAVKEGFEPPVPVSKYDDLANRWFKPLTHFTIYLCAMLSSRLCEKECKCI